MKPTQTDPKPLTLASGDPGEDVMAFLARDLDPRDYIGQTIRFRSGKLPVVLPTPDRPAEPASLQPVED